MMSLNRCLICFTALTAVAGLQFGFQAPPPAPATVGARYVDPFIGIDAGGNTLPGPSLPFGMVKPGPDVGKNDSNSGWAPTGDINGFSQMRVSGTGGGAKYGNILVQPTTGAPAAVGYGSPRRNERGLLGYYSVELARYGVRVEVTTAARAALYRFTYPATKQANILIDAGHHLVSYLDIGEGQTLVGSSVNVVSPTEITGSTSVKGGWNKQPVPYTVYFYAVTDAPAGAFGTWRGDAIQPGTRSASGDIRTGAWLSFGTREGQAVHLKVGISFIGVEQAKRNALEQIPGFEFDRVRAAAVAEWEKVLGAIEIQGASEDDLRMFYTSLYHTMMGPVDRTGENPLWRSSEPYYDDHYAIWDTFRTSSPLLTLIAEKRQVEILRALVDIYRHEGWMPDARSGNFNGRTQGGSDCDITVADGFVKGLKGIDWKTAFKALVQNAEVEPQDHFKEGRGGLQDWHKLGYLTIEGVDRSGSKHMEYAANDFAVATLAKGLGLAREHELYLKRSRNWENLWDPDFEDAGFKGFIRTRHRDGTWKRDFTALQGCTWGGDTFYEGNSWTYSLFVPHDVARLIEKCGGNERFIARLDAFFGSRRRYDVTNEPGFLAPYLYIWAGRHDKTADRIRQILSRSFRPAPDGLPGNDDSGAMSSWYAFSVMGFFPNAGQDVYLIGSPRYPLVTVRLGNGKTFSIEARGVSPENRYVASATLNGKPLDRAWFRHGEIAQGGRLVLSMAAKPGAWPSGDPPPSAVARPSGRRPEQRARVRTDSPPLEPAAEQFPYRQPQRLSLDVP